MTCRVRSRRHRDGYATVVVLIVIVLMTAITALNIDVALRLHRRVQGLDQRQQERWQNAAATPVVPPRAQP